MIREYLDKYQQELVEKRINLEKEANKNELSIKENLEFIRMLDNSEDKNYHSFTPVTNYKDNSEKIKELKEKHNELLEIRNSFSLEAEELNRKIDELNSILKVLKEYQTNQLLMEKSLDDNEIFRLKLLEVQEFERQRIARDLHDSTVQNLTSIVHKIEICSKLIDVDSVRCKMELQTMSKTVRDTISDMREVIYNLRPMSLDDIGIDETIEREISRIKKNGVVDVKYIKTGSSNGVLPVVALTILRIIQEACSNALKYAEADRILVKINYTNDEIELNVKDNGKGFNAAEIDKLKNSFDSGFGISMMNERVYLLSGTIDIKSGAEIGTEIYVKIPRKREGFYADKNSNC